MMLDNCTYNKIKMVYKISDLCWFIEKHAIEDAEKAGDMECAEILRGLQKDLEKHLEKVNKSLCIITQ